MNIHIETHPCRIASHRYFSIIFKCLLRRWWSALFLAVTILIAATCVDLRMGIVLLMFVFIIAPLVLFMLYYNYALRPEAFYSVATKVVIIHNQGIDCVYDEQQRAVLSWQQVSRVERTHEAFHIFTGRNTYFYLPREAFVLPQEMKYFENDFLPHILS